ncbi:MAG: acetamidase [Acidobacteria bacterium]|nr:acetamidase [Acidobacteriota bacterium]
MSPPSLVLLLPLLAQAPAHRVVAETYHHTFSAAHPVLLRVRPEEVVSTKTVDSAGFDFAGVRRTKTHGNPLTGPFFVEGAEPGDTLLVHLRRVRLNRTSGYTGAHVGVDGVPEALRAPKPAPDAVYAGYDYLVPWTIDLAKGLVRNGRFSFPAEPMLGCIGVAPEGSFSPRSGPAGAWGGNIDYRLIREGTTVHLPVYHPGALLFFGDGHALQGDGEPVGSGVETSLDVEFSTGLRKGRRLTGVRAETAVELVSIGSLHEQPTLNATLAIATRDMLRWLVEEHGLTAAEAHLLLGTQARYDVVTLGGSVAVRIAKRHLAALKR